MDLTEDKYGVKCNFPAACEESHLQSDSFETISFTSEHTCSSVDGSPRDICGKCDTKRYNEQIT